MEQHFYADSENHGMVTCAKSGHHNSNQQSDDISALLTDLPICREVSDSIDKSGDDSTRIFTFSNNPQSDLQGIELWFSKRTYILQKVEVNSPQAKTTV